MWHSAQPPSSSWREGKRMIEPLTKFSKWEEGGGGGAAQDLNCQRGVAEIELGDFYQGVDGCCNFRIKNKLKSEIFNDKKSLKENIFFTVITKNSNQEILTKNLVTYER